MVEVPYVILRIKPWSATCIASIPSTLPSSALFLLPSPLDLFFVWGHTQQCPGFTSSSMLRNHSWRAPRTMWYQGSNWVSYNQLEHPTHCTGPPILPPWVSYNQLEHPTHCTGPLILPPYKPICVCEGVEVALGNTPSNVLGLHLVRFR